MYFGQLQIDLSYPIALTLNSFLPALNGMSGPLRVQVLNDSVSICTVFLHALLSNRSWQVLGKPRVLSVSRAVFFVFHSSAIIALRSQLSLQVLELNEVLSTNLEVFKTFCFSLLTFFSYP